MEADEQPVLIQADRAAAIRAEQAVPKICWPPKFGKKRFGLEETQGRPSTPTNLIHRPHRRIFPQKTNEEVLSSRSKGERLILKAALATQSPRGITYDEDGLVVENDDPPFNFLRKGGWKPSGGRPAPIPPVKDTPRKPELNADGEEIEKKPVDVEKVTEHLWHEDVERRKNLREKKLEAALKKSANHQPNAKPLKPGEDPPPPPNVEKMTQRLAEEDVKRRNNTREKALEKALKANTQGRKEPAKIEDLDVLVEKMYTQGRHRQEQKKEALLRKVLKPQPPKKLSAEQQRASSARLYGRGREREKEVSAKMAKKYIDDRRKPSAKMTEEERRATGERLYEANRR